MVTCCSPAVVDVTIMRPDLKFQLGFTVKEGNVCMTLQSTFYNPPLSLSLLRFVHYGEGL